MWSVFLQNLRHSKERVHALRSRGHRAFCDASVAERVIRGIASSYDHLTLQVSLGIS